MCEGGAGRQKDRQRGSQSSTPPLSCGGQEKTLLSQVSPPAFTLVLETELIHQGHTASTVSHPTPSREILSHGISRFPRATWGPDKNSSEHSWQFQFASTTANDKTT